MRQGRDKAAGEVLPQSLHAATRSAETQSRAYAVVLLLSAVDSHRSLSAAQFDGGSCVLSDDPQGRSAVGKEPRPPTRKQWGAQPAPGTTAPY